MLCKTSCVPDQHGMCAALPRGMWASTWDQHCSLFVGVIIVGRQPGHLCALKIQAVRGSVAVQWLGLCTVTAVAWVHPLVRELRSHKLCGIAPLPPKNLTNKYAGCSKRAGLTRVPVLTLRGRERPGCYSQRDVLLVAFTGPHLS